MTKKSSAIIPPGVGGVYFVQAVNNGPIKIGYTKANVYHRMYHLGLICPYDLRWIGFVPGATMKNERELHNRFRSFRLRGEWYRPAPELRRYIRVACPDFDGRAVMRETFALDSLKKIRKMMPPPGQSDPVFQKCLKDAGAIGFLDWLKHRKRPSPHLVLTSLLAAKRYQALLKERRARNDNKRPRQKRGTRQN